MPGSSSQVLEKMTLGGVFQILYEESDQVVADLKLIQHAAPRPDQPAEKVGDTELYIRTTTLDRPNPRGEISSTTVISAGPLRVINYLVSVTRYSPNGQSPTLPCSVQGYDGQHANSASFRIGLYDDRKSITAVRSNKPNMGRSKRPNFDTSRILEPEDCLVGELYPLDRRNLAEVHEGITLSLDIIRAMSRAGLSKAQAFKQFGRPLVDLAK